MTSQIKKRIEQIQRGEVPQGYKKTKVGIVPSEWNENILSEYLQEHKQLSNDIEKHPVYSSSRQGLVPQSQYYDNREAVETNLGYKIVPDGYVTYRHMSDDDVFHFNINNTGGKVLVSSEYPVFTSTSQGCLEYIIPMLNEMARFRYFCRTQKKGGTRTRLYYKNLCTYKSAFPPLAEQEKIAEILSTQDKLIELNQRKIEELKKLKKYYLSKMFPQKGSNVPEIRFKGFTEPWEKREFGNVFEEYSEKNHEELPPLTIIQGKGTILRDESDRNLIYDKSGLKNYKLVHKSDFILHLRSFEGGLEVANSQGIVSPAYHIFHGENIDTEFYYLFFRTKYFINILLKPHVYGIRDGKSIDVDGMKTIEIPYPKIEEQKAIGKYIKSFDDLITINQRKCEELKKYKKALMQLLLIGIVRVKT